jgi:hypothetical protein
MRSLRITGVGLALLAVLAFSAIGVASSATADHNPESSIGEGNVYDARIDGHAAERAPRPPECEGDACSTPPSPPVDSTPSSFTFTGNGTTASETAKTPVKKKTKKKTKK